MELIKTQSLKGDVRIRIEYPSVVDQKLFETIGKSDTLSLLYRILFFLSFPISGLSLYLSLTA